MWWPLVIPLYLLAITSNVSEGKKKAKSVTTVLDAKWEQTPLVLEIAEYLAEESPDLFWQFIDGISAMDIPLIDLGSDKAMYDRSIAEASRLISPAQVSLLKLAVSLHIYSPRIEMHNQMALERGVKCPAAVDIAGTIVCAPEQLHHTVKRVLAQEKKASIETFRLDHHYPGSENKSTVAVLYGEVGSPEFAQFHKRLRQLATVEPIDYVLRYFIKERPNKKLRLSGYGVELQLKSTEYKAEDDTKVKGGAGADSQEEEEDEEIEGFVISKLKQMYPDKMVQLEKFVQELTESSDQLAPLKVWQFQELSLQAAQRILSAPKDEVLHTFTHIAQNFPMQAKSLVRTVVNSNFKNELQKNQERFSASLNLQPSDTAFFLNGIFFDIDLVDTMTILDSLRQEMRVLEGLHSSGITDKATLSTLLGLDLSNGGSRDYAIDIRDSAIQWVNDIEVDKQYRRWSASLMDLLRPTFPGMLRSVRKNLYNLVIIGDPAKTDVWPLVKLIESFYVHTAPLRLGLVFAVNSSASGLEDAGVALLNAYNYIAEVKDPYQGLSFITDVYATVKTDGERDVEVQDVIKLLRVRYHSADTEEILGPDTDYDTGRKLASDFVQRSGLRTLPQALINGIPLPEKSLNGEDFEEAVLTEIMAQTPAIQKAVYRGDLSDSHNVVDYLMDQPNVMPRLNEKILNTEKSRYLDLVKGVAKLSESMSYMSKGKLQPLTYWVVADLGQPSHRELLINAFDQMKSSGRIRVGLLVNSATDADQRINKLVLAALQQGTSVSTVLNILNDAEAVVKGDKTSSAYGLKDVDWEKLSATLELHQEHAGRVLGFPVGVRGIVCNGRVLGPFDADEDFTPDDFALLERFTMSVHVDKIYTALTMKSDDNEVTSDTVMKTVALLAARPQTRTRFELPELGEQHSVIKLDAQMPDEPALDIVVVVDPVSRGAQKIGPILSVLQQTTNCDIRIFLNCVEKNSDMPLKSFYRYVLEPEVQFTAEGRLSAGPIARFSNMPPAPLLTQNMHVPDNWLVESVASPYDLDNIRLEEVESVVHSQFELEYLLLEGHCFESTMGNPPRGLQITLGTESQPVQVDTIVMANLGYFQLKANPGAWILRLRQGRSADLFDITSHEGSDTPENSTDIKVLISSFRPHVLKLKVTKKPDKMNMDLLSEDDQPQAGIWNSITSSKEEPLDPTDTTINIFSVASGHLYERFLRIMMLSVLKNTKSPVKFWFLKNYLSPTFKDFLPRMAAEYGFEFELVQYKWPRWLHQQSEKQRIIWGYKILFLDVLFPLHIKKIIFVDADQVVRADMKELVDLDLGGAPYGYTPFCDSRTEMDGFRVIKIKLPAYISVTFQSSIFKAQSSQFDLENGGLHCNFTKTSASNYIKFWKQGYWRNHLQGRRYHISALYVVDLKRFRRIAAGDRLRGQYQALSQDPNSLSNLDQDLPNNMIHQVAIKSLPQEWLWCETWCDDGSKTSAKTIDLCNNPLTKEAKLTAAMRIVEEWKDYDDEIKRLQLRLGATDDHEEEESATQKPVHSKHTEL